MNEAQSNSVDIGSVTSSEVLPVVTEVTETSSPIVATVESVVTVELAKPAKERKPRVKVEKPRGRGRPNVYVGALMTLIVAMVRSCHNVSLVRAVLTADGKKNDHTANRKGLLEPLGFKKPLTISLPMLGKYAKDHGIELPKGRPSRAEQAKQATKLNNWINKKLGKSESETKAA